MLLLPISPVKRIPASYPCCPVRPLRSVRGGLLGLCALRPCRPFLPGPGFRVSVASPTDGTRSWAGSGQVQPPDTGLTRERASEHSARNRVRPGPDRLHLRLRAPTLETALASTLAGLRRGLLRVPGRAARRDGDPTTRLGVAVTRARRPATPRASASLTVLARAGCAACRACAQTRSARGDGAGLRLPAPSFHARERVRSHGLLGGWSPVRAVSRAPSLAAALCEAVHRRKPCCLPSLSRLALRLTTDAARQTRGSAELRR